MQDMQTNQGRLVLETRGTIGIEWELKTRN